jgi:hypothetical protein
MWSMIRLGAYSLLVQKLREGYASPLFLANELLWYQLLSANCLNFVPIRAQVIKR